MAKHQWTIVCERAIVDRFSNNLTIVGVVEQVNYILQRTGKGTEDTSAPVVPAEFTVVSLWHRSDPSVPEDGNLRVRLLSPSGKPISPDSELKIELTGEKLRARTLLNCRGVPIRESGEYQVQVQQLQKNGRWKTESVVPIDVTLKLLPGIAEAPVLEPHH